MKTFTATPLTLVLVAALLAGSGICVGMRHAADRERRERAAKSAGNPRSTASAVDDRRDRSAAETGIGISRTGDRAVLRKKLDDLWSGSGSNLQRNRGVLAMIDGINPADLPAFFDELYAASGGNEQMAAVALAAWAEIDPAAALEREMKMTGESVFPSTVLKIWAERDPVAALNWLSGRDQSAKQIDQVLKQLAADNPAAALAWAREKDAEGSGAGRLAVALQGMLHGRMDEALRSFSGLSAEERKNVLAAVSAEAGTMDAATRKRWLESLPEGEQRDAAVAAMIGGMMRMSTVKERLELLKEYPGAAELPGGEVLFRQWVIEDRKEALAFLDRLPEGKVREKSIQQAMLGMVFEAEGKDSLELINRYPQVVDEQVLLSWFDSVSCNEHEWELALSQIPRVNSLSIRAQAYQSVMRSWFFSDRDGAKVWLDSHRDGVPEDVVKSLELR